MLGLKLPSRFELNMIISLIAAMDRNRLIGSDNGMPWHLPADLAHFRKMTVNKPVVMGRKTLQSIGKVLPKRTNIVMTRQPEFAPFALAAVSCWMLALVLALGFRQFRRFP